MSYDVNTSPLTAAKTATEYLVRTVRHQSRQTTRRIQACPIFDLYNPGMSPQVITGMVELIKYYTRLPLLFSILLIELPSLPVQYQSFKAYVKAAEEALEKKDYTPFNIMPPP